MGKMILSYKKNDDRRGQEVVIYCFNELYKNRFVDCLNWMNF